ncbi:hypothetical protein ACFLXH_03045 [Chloroflexota bacterium]
MSREKPFQANCRTTAMSILPHTDPEQALELVLGLDVPFWPQLPNISFNEDMYAQASYDFPGVTIHPEDGKITFSHEKFEQEIDEYSRRLDDPESFRLSQSYADIYRKFLGNDLKSYPAIHGQIPGPVNLGFRINDENGKPIVYDDNIRGLLFDFIQRKFNAQYQQLHEKNKNAFVWLDEPGLIWVFSGLAGYNDIQAKRDYQDFLTTLEGIRGLHLCTNINMTYLLELGIDLLSFDAYQIETMPVSYAESAAKFTRNGGIISWGIVPTEPLKLKEESVENIAARLLGYWEVIADKGGVPLPQIAAQALLAPAKCCVKSLEFSNAKKTGTCEIKEEPGSTAEQQSVATAYSYLKKLSLLIRDKFDFPD